MTEVRKMQIAFKTCLLSVPYWLAWCIFFLIVATNCNKEEFFNRTLYIPCQHPGFE
jgi:hypothetical protein